MRLSSASPSALPALLHRAWVQLRAPLRFRVDFFTSVLGNVMVMAVGGTLLATMFQHIPSLGGWTGWEVLFLWAWLETVIALAHFGLFTPIPGLAVDDRGHQVYKVDEADLCRLADAELCVLRQHGWLRALYAHQVSLANVDLPAAQLAHRSPEAFA
jgi:hypothetical protein